MLIFTKKNIFQGIFFILPILIKKKERIECIMSFLFLKFKISIK